MVQLTQQLSQAAGASDNIFWLFSSAAQAIAAFVAFLLAGYALVHTMMEAAATADETLVEIHEELKRRYYRRLATLVVLTAAAIVACFAVIYFNGTPSGWFVVLQTIAASLILLSIIGGVAFVISVVDPDKYRKAAVQMAREAEAQPSPAPTEGEIELATVKRGDFAEAFIDLEERVRQLWELRTHGERLRKAASSSSPPAFREMLQALNLAEALPASLAEELEALNRYRNLVFHGHLKSIDPEMVYRVRRAAAQVSQLLNAGY